MPSALIAKMREARTSMCALEHSSAPHVLKFMSKPFRLSKATSSLFSKMHGIISRLTASNSEVTSAFTTSCVSTERSATPSPKSMIRPQPATTDACCAPRPKNLTSRRHPLPKMLKSLQREPLTRQEHSLQRQMKSIRSQQRLQKLPPRQRQVSSHFGAERKLWSKRISLPMAHQLLKKARELSEALTHFLQ